MPTLAEEFAAHRAAQPERDAAALGAQAVVDALSIAGYTREEAIAESALRFGKGTDAMRERKLPADFDVHVYLAERQKLAEADRQKLIERDKAARQAAIDDAKGRLF